MNKVLLLLLALLMPAFVSAQGIDDPFDAGVTAFSQGDYERALRNFQEAAEAGQDFPQLRYNTAMALFRLERYEEAALELRPLDGNPEWEPLVLYNLGLIEEAQGNLEAAKGHYTQSLIQTREPDIRVAARTRLTQLQAAQDNLSRSEQVAEPQRISRSTNGILSVAAGVDGNVSSLSDEFLQDSTSGGQDYFLETLAFAQFYPVGGRGDGVRLYGLGFNRAHRDFEDLDSLVFGGGAVLEKPLAVFESELGLRMTRIRLDNAQVADQLQVQADLLYRLSFGWLEIETSYSNYDAGERYQHIDGDQQRLDLTWNQDMDEFLLSIGYRYETNDREDLANEPFFRSYSPVRQGIFGELSWRVSDQFSAEAGYEYFDDKYDGINVLRDTDGLIREAQRERTRTELQLLAIYRFNPRWRLSAEMEYSRVNDVFNLYSYDKTRFLTAFEYQF